MLQVVKLVILLLAGAAAAELVLQGRQSPIRPTTYPMNEEKEICMVARPGTAVLLQPSTLQGQNGQFFVHDLDKALFTVWHIQQNCHQQDQQVQSQCDTLWINLTSSAMARGFFYANYTNGQSSIRTRILYGPEGISYTGAVPPTDAPVMIPPSPGSIQFELRTPDPLEARHANVCERTGNGDFQQSRLLEAPTSIADPKCATAYGVGTSVPYIIPVTLHRDADVNNLTARDIKIVFGPCNGTTGLMSEPLRITGAVSTAETTSHAVADRTTPPTDVTSPGSTQSPPPTPSSSTATSTPSTSTSSQPTNNGHIVSTPVAIAILVAVLLLLVVAVVIIGAAIAWHKKRRKEVPLGGVVNPIKPDSYKEESIDAVKTTRSSSASSHASIECDRLVSNVASPEQHSPEQHLSQHHTTPALITNSSPKQYETALLRQIRDNTGEIVEGIKVFHKDTKELKIGQEQILDQIDAQNLS